MKKESVEIPGIGSVVITTNKRAKNIRLTVASGKLKVSKPPRVPHAAVVVFVRKNHIWAQNKLNESKQTKIIHDGDVLAPETVISFFPTSSNDTTVKPIQGGLEVRLAKSASAKDQEVQELVVEALVPIWRKAAKGYLPRRIDELAAVYNFKYNDLRLKYIHTRWGSCSSDNNINLNIQLMKLDEDLIDHVLLHELSHTKALNHGTDFWRVFEGVRPGAKDERKQLKQMVIF